MIMRPSVPRLLTLVWLSVPLLASPSLLAQAYPEGFEESIIFDGLLSPTAARFAPDGRVFVAEKSGRILVFSSLEDDEPTVVADLGENVYDAWDRGLLGLAIHPSFPTEPWIYVLYTFDAAVGGTPPAWGDDCPDPPGFTRDGCVVSGRLSRLEVQGDVMVGEEQVLIEAWCQQFPSHSIGDLQFGLDGALYVSAGDGASFNYVDYGQTGNACGDPVGEGGALRSQDLLTPEDELGYHGSILRVDPITGEALPDNPLFGGEWIGDDRVIANGLRNPFRFCVHPLTNRLYIGDVGWSAWEEINVVEDPLDGLVENFGWPCYEGDPRQDGYDLVDLPLCETLYATGAVTEPLLAYDHRGSRAVTGLTIYTGDSYPVEYLGALFFADYSGRFIRYLPVGDDGELDPDAQRTFHSGARAVDLQSGPGGDLFFVDIALGQVKRVSYFPVNHPPKAVARSDQRFGSSPLRVRFDASESVDPDEGDQLIYDWDLDGDGELGDASGMTAEWLYQSSGPFRIRLRVTDLGGLSDEALLDVTVDDSPPEIEMLKPESGQAWSVGDPIHFAASGVDPDLGPLADSAFDWTIVLQHCADQDPDHDCHEHVLQRLPGVREGKLIAPDHEYPSYLELRLQARDSGPPDWWDASWSWRRRLFFDLEELPIDLFDVPVLVRLEPDRIDYDRTAPGGADLRFVDEAGNELPYEIESWQPGGLSEVWVEVPRLEAGTRWSHVWMYWGNPSAVEHEQPLAVWDGDHVAVWHLSAGGEDATGRPQRLDSYGTSSVAGWIHEAQWLDGAGSYLVTPSTPDLDRGGQLSFEAWFRLDAPELDREICLVSTRADDGSGGWAVVLNPAKGWIRLLGSGADFAEASGLQLDAGWHHLAVSLVGFFGRISVDGVLRTTDVLMSPVVRGGQPFAIGRRSETQGGYFPGTIDEVRFDAVARHPEWVRVQYRSMSDSLLRFGPRQDSEGLTAEVRRDLHPATVDLGFETVPPGLELVVGSRKSVAPFQRTLIRGGRTTVSAPLEQVMGGVRYRFTGWSDGSSATHEVDASKPFVSVARYRATGGKLPRGTVRDSGK